MAQIDIVVATQDCLVTIVKNFYYTFFEYLTWITV